MSPSPRAVAASALLAFLVGGVLWPPGAVYWTALAAVIGDGPTLALVALLSALAGAAAVRVGGLDPASLALGGALAYVLGMALVGVVVATDSPAHLLLYGALLVCFLGGAAGARYAGGSRTRPGLLAR